MQFCSDKINKTYCYETIYSSSGIKWALGDTFLIPHNELPISRFTIDEDDEGEEKEESIAKAAIKIKKDYIVIHIPEDSFGFSSIDSRSSSRFSSRFLTFIKNFLPF